MNTKPQPIELEWLDYLCSSGVILPKDKAMILTLLERKGTRSHAIIYMNRMMEEHPDEWFQFKAKMRVLGRL